MTVINDTNWKDFLDPVRCGLKPNSAPIPYATDKVLTEIPEAEWKHLYELRIKNGSRNEDVFRQSGGFLMNQLQTPLCWMFATALNFGYARVYNNLPYISYSPASAAAFITGWRYRGGWGGEAISRLVTHGINESKDWGDTSFDRRLDTTANATARARNKATEIWRIQPTMRQVMSAMLQGFTISSGYNWWGHQVNLFDPYLRNDQWAFKIANSWGPTWGDRGWGYLTGTRMIPNDCVIIRTVLI